MKFFFNGFSVHMLFVVTRFVSFSVLFPPFLPTKNWIKNVIQLEKIKLLERRIRIHLFVSMFFFGWQLLSWHSGRLLFCFYILFITHAEIDRDGMFCENWHVSRKNQWRLFSIHFILFYCCLFCSCLNLFHIFHILLALYQCNDEREKERALAQFSSADNSYIEIETII